MKISLTNTTHIVDTTFPSTPSTINRHDIKQNICINHSNELQEKINAIQRKIESQNNIGGLAHLLGRGLKYIGTGLKEIFFGAASSQNMDSSKIIHPKVETKSENAETPNQTHLMEVDKEIDVIYTNLNMKIDAAISQSKLQNKPLLILIGEHHYKFPCAVYETIILNIAKSYSIKYLLTEAFQLKSYRRCVDHWGPIYLAEKVASELGMQKIPIDLGLCEEVGEPKECVHFSKEDRAQYPSFTDAYTTIHYEKSQNERNSIMAKFAKKNCKDNNNANQVAIVGACHLKGLADKLQEEFHIVPLHVSPIEKFGCGYSKSNSEIESINFAQSTGVQLPNIEFLKSDSDNKLEPSVVIDRVRNAAQRNLKKNDKGKIFDFSQEQSPTSKKLYNQAFRMNKHCPAKK